MCERCGLTFFSAALLRNRVVSSTQEFGKIGLAIERRDLAKIQLGIVANRQKGFVSQIQRGIVSNKQRGIASKIQKGHSLKDIK